MEFNLLNFDANFASTGNGHPPNLHMWDYTHRLIAKEEQTNQETVKLLSVIYESNRNVQ